MAATLAQVHDLAQRGQRALASGDLAGARGIYEQLVTLEAANPQHWIKLAIACRGADQGREEAAITHALSLDPMELVALILRGNLLERQGRRHEAAHAYAAVASVAPPMGRLHPDLHAAVTHAIGFSDAGIAVEPFALRNTRRAPYRLLRVEWRLSGDFVE